MTQEINNKNYCADCIKCKNCSKKLSIIMNSNQNDVLMIKTFRVCEECWKFYKNVKNVCLNRNIIVRNALKFIKISRITNQFIVINAYIVRKNFNR